ncbi:MAG: tetratricopeptide repeat protein [Candidatus Peregrinibacteria bacterium]
MRKLLAIIFALVLALAFAVGYGAYKKGLSWRDLDLKTVRQIVLDFGNGDEPKSDEPVVEVMPEVEENLSYDERMSKGDYFSERGFLTFAANEYVKASNLEPKRMEPYSKLLETHFALGDYDKAKLNADTLLILDPQNLEARYWLSQIHLKQGAYEEAKRILGELAATSLQDPRLDYDRALLHILDGEYKDAKKLLESATGKSPAPELQAKVDRLLSAFQEFEFAQAAETLYLDELISRALSQNGDYELAIFKLKNVLRTRSDLRDAWILLGFSYLNLEEYYFALTSFQRAYELDSEWPATQYFLALTHQELGDYEQAIQFFNFALSNQFDPPAVIHQKLADLYLETENYEAAVQAYQKVLELSDGDVNAFIRPIWIYLDKLSQPQEALKLAELSMTTFPDNPMAYNLLGWAQMGTGDLTAAEANLKKALELSPSLAAAHFNLGKLFEQQGLMNKASEEYQSAYDLDPNGSIGRSAAERYNALMKTQ